MTHEGEERLNVWLDAEVKQALKEQDESMKRNVNEALRAYLGVDLSTEAAFNREIERLQRESDRLADQIDELQEQHAHVQEQLEDVHRRREEFLRTREDYAHRLDTILCEVVHYDLRSVYGRRGEVREAALQEYGNKGEDAMDKVVEDVHERARERGVHISPGVFTESGNVAVATDGDGGTPFKSVRGGEDDE